VTILRALARLSRTAAAAGGPPGPHPTSEERPVATVTIHRTDGSSETVPNVDEDLTIYYENLPFSDGTVERVDVRL